MSGSIDTKGKVVILGAARTPIGAIGGSLASLQAEALGIAATKGALEQCGVDPKEIQYSCFGWVMQDPRSPNLARNVAMLCGVPHTSPATTIHENCASGGAAVHSLTRRILLGEVDIGLAGGTESMSNVARYLYPGRLKGQLYGDMKLLDGVQGSLVDGHVGKKGELMGLMSERLVEKYGVTREEQDDVAFRSHQNALKTWNDGLFADYVVPVEIPQRRGDPIVVTKDEGPKDIPREKFAAARPYFKPDGGTITGINSSSINDAGAALIISTEEKAKELGIKPLATLLAYHNVGVPREYMGEGAFKVVPHLLEKAGVAMTDVDYFELNEAFSVVLAAAFHDLEGLEVDRCNQWGSGVSLGHPVGCTGARQIVDMVHQLPRRDAHIGVTTRCVGGGIGSGEVLIVE